MPQPESEKAATSAGSEAFFKEINTLKEELHEFKKKWEEAQLELHENNVALEALAKSVNKNNFETKLKIAKRLQSEILPILEEIKTEKNSEKIRILVELAIGKVNMFMPNRGNHRSILTMLTPMEMRIAAMIKDGFKSEDIARKQFISLDTVKTHRGNIRKKLGLNHRQVNLASYLKTTFS